MSDRENTAEQAAIRDLVSELDRLVPRDGACAYMVQYGGGPDEGRFAANRAGFLRFGIEFLKGGLAPPGEEDGQRRRAVPVDLEYLVAFDSTDGPPMGLDEFILDEALAPDHPPERQGGNIVGMALGMGCLISIVLAGVGLVTVIRQIFS